MKSYLGDAVYADFIYGHIVLTVDYGNGPVEKIYLNLDTYRNLIDYVDDLKNLIKKEKCSKFTDKNE